MSASPLYGDLADLPPIQLHVGEDEVLLDDARRHADLLAKSGPAAELHVWLGMVHVFPANPALLHRSRGARCRRGVSAAQSRPLQGFAPSPITPTRMEKSHDPHFIRRPEA
jgi:acetyl esterase/lipase